MLYFKYFNNFGSNTISHIILKSLVWNQQWFVFILLNIVYCSFYIIEYST